MSNEIKYYFNIGDRIVYINEYDKNGTIGVITDKPSTLFKNYPNNDHFNVEVIESERFRIGDVLGLSKNHSTFELLETANFEGCERLQYKDSKKYKTMVKDGFITFEKNDDYIEFENGSKITGIDIANGKDKATRGNRADVFVTLDEENEFKFNKNKFICVKDCIYKSGYKVEIIRRVKDYIVVTDGKNINPFRENEFEEYFTEYIEINKTNFKMVDIQQIKVMKNL